MKVQKTREAILDVSLKLFNEKKASNVSTVQIASELNISPGNLYYYFRNKEEIIRCLWDERIIDEIINGFDHADNIEDFDHFVMILQWVSEHIERYQFFYTEMPTLFLNDPDLMKVHVEYEKKNIKGIYTLINNLCEREILEPLDEDGKVMLTEGLWAMAEGMLDYYYYLSVSNKQVSDLSKIWMLKISLFFKPYFREEYRNHIMERLDANNLDMTQYLQNFKNCYIEN